MEILEAHTHPTVVDAERKFIKLHQLEEYHVNNNINRNSTILYSRSLNKNFFWPNDKELSTNVLDFFKNSGHSIAINYGLTYKRKASWDLDCICRRISEPQYSINHITESVVNSLCSKVAAIFEDILKTKLKEKKINIKFSVWQRACGFHIYTNVDISLPLHIYLTELLMNEFYNTEMMVIEIPTYMPLPYSAKLIFKPYTFCSGYKDLNYNANSHQFIEFIKVRQDLTPNVIGSLQVLNSNIYFEKVDYFKTVSEILFTNHRNGEMETNYIKLLEYFNNTKHVLQINEQINLSLENPILTEFIKFYNNLKYGDERTDWSDFIENSILKYGTFYLQHYSILYYKFLESKQIYDFETLKGHLQTIYEQHLQRIPTIGYFIDNLDDKTTKEYESIKLEELANYLNIIDLLKITPNSSELEKLEKYVNQKTGADNLSEVFCRKFETNVTIELKSYLDSYIEALKLFGILLTDGNTGWILKQPQGHYQLYVTKPDCLPGLTSWCGQEYSKLKGPLLNYIYSSTQLKVTLLWSNTNFAIACPLGVFNSITRMYNASLPWFRYSRSRNNILNSSSLNGWENDLNEKIYEKLHKAQYILSDFEKKAQEIYLYYVVAPSLMHLKSCSNFPENQIYALLTKIPEYDLNLIDFIFDFYPIDIKMFVLNLHFIQKYDLSTASCFQFLFSNIWKGLSYTPLKNTWLEKFSELENITFTESKDYLTKIMSVKSSLISNFSKRDALLTIILSISQLRNCNFREFCKFFNFVMPKPIEIHPWYKNPLKTSLDYRNLLNKIIKHVYKFEMNISERNCVYFLIKMLMSSSFNYETFYELMSMFSNLYTLDNVLKVFYVLYGPKNTGKTHISKILQHIVSPFYFALLELKEAIQRSNLQAVANVIFINELSKLEASMLKSITGGDLSSAKTFKVQEYRNFINTSLLIAATNDIPDFKTQNIDIYSVDRMHSINLDGAQVAEENWFNKTLHFVQNEYIGSVIPTTELNDAHSLDWLSMLWYTKTKDSNHYPHVNKNTEHSIQFRHDVSYKNNKCYRFLVNCGIYYVPNVSIERKTLNNMVENYIQTQSINNNHCDYTSLALFHKDFNINFPKKRTRSQVYHNFIEKKFYDHICMNFKIVEKQGSKIDTEEVFSRSQVYGSKNETAINLFALLNDKYYNHQTDLFENIEFVYEVSHYEYLTEAKIDLLPESSYIFKLVNNK